MSYQPRNAAFHVFRLKPVCFKSPSRSYVISRFMMSMSMSMSTVDFYSASPHPPLMRYMHYTTHYYRITVRLSVSLVYMYRNDHKWHHFFIT